MSKLGLFLFIGAFVVINVIFIIIRSTDSLDEDEKMRQKTIKQLRKMQAVNLRENSLMRKFDEVLEEKTKPDKRYRIETLAMQAGFPNLSYGEIVIMQWGFTILLASIAFFAMENFILSIVLAFVGRMIPTQVLSTIANRRLDQMGKQVGSFIQLITERYSATGDLSKAIQETAPDFKGLEPMNSEIQRTILDMKVGTPTETAMKNLGRRTGNKFLTLFANYYSIAATLGTEDARDRIVRQAWVQFEEDHNMKRMLREQIAGPKNEAYIMLSFIPVVIIYQISTNDTYLPFMLNTEMGKIGTAAIILVMLGSLWFINKKIGAPLE